MISRKAQTCSLSPFQKSFPLGLLLVTIVSVFFTSGCPLGALASRGLGAAAVRTGAGLTARSVVARSIRPGSPRLPGVTTGNSRSSLLNSVRIEKSGQIKGFHPHWGKFRTIAQFNNLKEIWKSDDEGNDVELIARLSPDGKIISAADEQELGTIHGRVSTIMLNVDPVRLGHLML